LMKRELGIVMKLNRVVRPMVPAAICRLSTDWLDNQMTAII
jgi:hypothetical protein